jgi:dTDP-4-dehydrorhamnose 3,5-epimerase
MSLNTKKDVQTVNPDSTPIHRLIEGVVIRSAITHADERGTLCEIYNPAWGIHPADMVYAYTFTLRPGKIKGWGVHYKRDDRIFNIQGSVKCVMYDARPDSPTYNMINEVHITDYDRGLMIIPAGVFHAHQNIGQIDAIFVSLPSNPYDHSDPDVHRLPPDTDQIPYKFSDKLGW